MPLADAVANLGAVGVGVAGLAAGRTDLLARMTVDRLHEPYRAKVFPQLPRLVAAAREAGALGACLSGAGSTILAFADSMVGISRIEGAFAAAAADTDLDGRILVVEPRNAGAQVVVQQLSECAMRWGPLPVDAAPTLRAWTVLGRRSGTGSRGWSPARSTRSARRSAASSMPATRRCPTGSSGR